MMREIGLYMLLLLCVTLVSSPLGYAQGLEEDLKKINAAYAERDVLSLDIDYAFFSEGKTKATESIHSRVVKYKDSIYNKMGDTETFLIKNRKIMINHNLKRILVEAAQPAEFKNSFDPLKYDVKWLLKEHTILDNTLDAGEWRTYKLSMVKGAKYDNIDIVLNKNTHMLKQLVFYLKNQGASKVMKDPGVSGKVVVTYTEIGNGSKPDTGVFDFSKLIVYSQGKYRLHPACKDYKLIDNTL